MVSEKGTTDLGIKVSRYRSYFKFGLYEISNIQQKTRYNSGFNEEEFDKTRNVPKNAI